MKRAIATLCTLALAGFGAFADATLSDPQQQQRQKGPIRVQTDLVSILVSVTDDKGEPVIGLNQSAFQLSEEGVAQKIVRFEPQTNRPLDLALMLDASGSAAIELKIEREAAAHFIEEVVRPDDRLAVFSFAADVVQLSNFSAISNSWIAPCAAWTPARTWAPRSTTQSSSDRKPSAVRAQNAAAPS